MVVVLFLGYKAIVVLSIGVVIVDATLLFIVITIITAITTCFGYAWFKFFWNPTWNFVVVPIQLCYVCA